MENKKSLWDNTLFCCAIMIFCCICWGGGYIAQKYGMEEGGMTPEAVFFSRELLATIFIYFGFRKRIKEKYVKGDWKGGLIGAVFFVAGTFFQQYGLINTSPGIAGFLTTTYVVIVPLLWWVIKKERPSNLLLFCCVLAVIGLGFLSLTDGFHMKTADILVLICAFLFSGYIMSISAFARDTDPVVLTFIIFLSCTVMSFIAFLINDGNWAQFFTKPALISIIYLAVLFTFLSNMLQVFVQAHVSAGLAGIMLSLESLFAALFGILFGYDAVTLRFVIGGLLMLTSVLLPAFSDYFAEKKQMQIENQAE